MCGLKFLQLSTTRLSATGEAGRGMVHAQQCWYRGERGSASQCAPQFAALGPRRYDSPAMVACCRPLHQDATRAAAPCPAIRASFLEPASVIQSDQCSRLSTKMPATRGSSRCGPAIAGHARRAPSVGLPHQPSRFRRQCTVQSAPQRHPQCRPWGGVVQRHGLLPQAQRAGRRRAGHAAHPRAPRGCRTCTVRLAAPQLVLPA